MLRTTATTPSSPVWTPPHPWVVAPPPVPAWRARLLRVAVVGVPVAVLGLGIASLALLGAVRGGQVTTGHGTPVALRPLAATGVLTATHGDSWTVRTASGLVTVDLGPHTRFGTAAHPTQESGFRVGEQVRVSGRGAGAMLTASHVVPAPVTSTRS